MKPLTGMEGSGNCVRYVLSYYQIPPQDLSKKMIVVLDDQTILPGSIQIKGKILRDGGR